MAALCDCSLVLPLLCVDGEAQSVKSDEGGVPLAPLEVAYVHQTAQTSAAPRAYNPSVSLR